MLSIFIMVFLVGGTQAAVSCLNRSGQPVDWYIMLKLPNNIGSSTQCPNLSSGVAFLYIDSSSYSDWQYSSVTVTQANQPLGYTLNQMYANMASKPHVRILYNDNPPDGMGTSSSYRGHNKGVAYFEADRGFWLIHSVPNFPPKTNYAYPTSGDIYGHSAICVTLNTQSQLDNVAAQLQYMMPNIYDSANTLNSGSTFLAKVLNEVSISSLPFTRQTTITTAGGQQFQHFAKCKKWLLDLYGDLVKPQLGVSLYVESWLNGAGVDLASNCDTTTSYQVHNLRNVRPAGIEFESSKDSSKWAVSYTSGRPWTCVGDINRQQSQDDRPGGTLCLNNAQVNALFLRGTLMSETCSGASPLVSTGQTQPNAACPLAG